MDYHTNVAWIWVVESLLFNDLFKFIRNKLPHSLATLCDSHVPVTTKYKLISVQYLQSAQLAQFIYSEMPDEYNFNSLIWLTKLIQMARQTFPTIQSGNFWSIDIFACVGVGDDKFKMINKQRHTIAHFFFEILIRLNILKMVNSPSYQPIQPS